MQKSAETRATRPPRMVRCQLKERGLEEDNVNAFDILDGHVKRLNDMLWPESWGLQLRMVFTGGVIGTVVWCLAFLALVLSR
jgi:hypothetical protein